MCGVSRSVVPLGILNLKSPSVNHHCKDNKIMLADILLSDMGLCYLFRNTYLFIFLWYNSEIYNFYLVQKNRFSFAWCMLRRPKNLEVVSFF
jgi:hypothetical protein